MSDDVEQPLIQSNYPNAQVHQTSLLQNENIKKREDEVKLEKSYFEIMGLCCSSEVPLIEGILKPLNGVKEISVVVPTKTLMVVHDIQAISPSQIVKALNQASLEASVRPRGESNYTKQWPGKWDIACGVLLLLSLFKYIYQPMQWLAIVAVLIGVPNIIWRSIASVRNLTLNVNVIVLIAIGGTIALQDYTDAAIIVFLYNIAQWLESRASYKAMSVMSSLTSMTPLKATLTETGKQVDVTSVDLSTIIAVKAGEIIPIDGVVVDGKCEVDEKALTGESFPVIKETGFTVLAGTINLNGYINVKTTMLAENCLVARMVNLVEEAQSRKAKIQTFIDDCAKWYIPTVVLLSAGIAVIPIVLQYGDKMHWFHLALVVLVSACPCALVISTPVTIFCALSKAATTGLLFKGGDYLELLARVKTVAFDKTGTITTGEFSVTQFQSLNETISIEKLLFWVSSIESKSSHPMAAALVNYATTCSIEPMPEKVEEFQNFPGEGIYGKVEGALEAVKELKELGIATVMLTGDNHVAAQQVQYELDGALDIVHARLLPEDKAKIIEKLKKDGAVAMVGDGINDALALATTDIGISMGISGSALAMETGHVILMSNDIRKIPQAIRISKKASRKIIENVIISFCTKGVVLALAIAGYSMLLVAVVTDVGTCLLVILNSMLLLQGTEEYKKSTRTILNKACCNTNCKGEVKCQSELNKQVNDQLSNEKAEKPSKGCCDAKKSACNAKLDETVENKEGCCDAKKSACNAKLDEIVEKKDCETSSCGKNKVDVGCCKRVSICRNGKCRSSSGCSKFGASTSIDILIA
ncbi:Cadmium/zinc-transporting ATPase HMA2 [Bienertia sinuspersici]